MLPNQHRVNALIMFVAFVLLLIPTASASIYSDPVMWYQHGVHLWIIPFASPVQAMHDCSDDTGHCMSVVWDDYDNQLKVFYISDPEDNTSWCPQYPSTSCSQPPIDTIAVDFPFARWNDSWSNWRMGFGVMYSPIWAESYEEYFIWKNGQVYRMPMDGSNEILRQDYTSGGAYNYRTFIGQGEDDNGEPFLLALDTVIWSLVRYYPYNNTFLSEDYLTGHSWQSACLENCVAGTPTGYNWVRWYYARNSENESGYLVYNYTRSGASPFWTVQAHYKNMPSGFNSTHFYLDGQVYGVRENYPSATDGVYTSTTSDFLTYGTPVLYYTYDSTKAEDINATWGVRTERSKIYQFDRWRNTTDIDRGIGVSIVNVSRVLVNTEYISASGETYPATVTMELECRDSNWTSGSINSNYEEFFTDCVNLKLILDTMTYLPYHTELNFTVPDGCSTYRLDFDFRIKHALDIYMRDFFNGSAVSGVTVNVNSIVKVTDSNGLVEYLLNPFENLAFELHYTVSDCYLQYRANGDEKAYSLYATKTGYFPISGETFTIADYPAQKTFQIIPIHASVTVNVFTSDGVPIETSLASVTSTGATTTYVLNPQGIPVLTSTATRFPAVFRLFDDRSSYTATFNLTQVDYYETKNQVIDSGTPDYVISFYLPNSTECIFCTSLSHCPESFCKGIYFYELTACTDGCCVYDVEACLVCNAEVGCYDETGTESCYFDTDCEDVCYNSATLKESSCGSENICLYHYVDCPYGCIEVVDGEDYCEPAPVVEYCDQSTVTGMLTCVQAGILGFIAGTYDPMMYFMVVIFLVIIVVAMISLAFRGTQRVIR